MGKNAAQHSVTVSFWLVFVNLTPTRVTWEEGATVEELPPSDWLMGKPEDIFLL